MQESIEFYSKLLGTAPTKRRLGHINFAATKPPLKLVLLEGDPAKPWGMATAASKSTPFTKATPPSAAARDRRPIGICYSCATA
ncbi:hypothetical protein AB0K15_13200 [Amycolatopsis sp. NPDC049253]|uniref:hypothetical protein n=1 Tax=Amycolatopsis sp. NPDC049253 TaxID=3155274 RepID=UPI003448EE39